MQIFEKKRTKFWNKIKLTLPAIFLALLCLIFLFSIHTTSQKTLLQEQQTLQTALESGAVHTYALNGRYPENLTQLLENYHITYDTEKFIVEYVPNGSNLFPSISVLLRTTTKGGTS